MTAIHALTMPKWGLAMTEGKITGWAVAEGASIAPGHEIVDIETTKITNGLETNATGVLRRIVAAPGQTLPVGALLGVIAPADVPDADIDTFIAGFTVTAPDEDDGAAAAAEPETIDIAGRPMRRLVVGQGDGPPMVLIHGFGGDLDNWLFTSPTLAEKRQVHAIDLPGHGGSTKDVGDGSIAALAASVAAYMDAEGIGSTHLVGHSMGGAIALTLALEQPDRVASITLLAPAGLGPEIDSSYIEGFIAAERRKDLKPHLEKLFADPSPVSRDLVENVLKMKRLDGVGAALRTIADAVFPGGRQALDFRGRLGEVAAPMQIVWGGEDRIVPASHAEGVPVETHLLKGKGHMAHMEAAAEVNRLIEALADRA
ncbi:MAG: acetoin dehydrogenase dihydrolipoyllysine-residue acetyltransferase subunit [Inquilinaceae bacterium]